MSIRKCGSPIDCIKVLDADDPMGRPYIVHSSGENKSAVQSNCAQKCLAVAASYSPSYGRCRLPTGTGTRAGFRAGGAFGSSKSSISFRIRRPNSSSSSQTLRLCFATKSTFHATAKASPHSSGPEGTRTPDFHNAIVALSQLSYRPLRRGILALTAQAVNRGRANSLAKAHANRLQAVA